MLVPVRLICAALMDFPYVDYGSDHGSDYETTTTSCRLGSLAFCEDAYIHANTEACCYNSRSALGIRTGAFLLVIRHNRNAEHLSHGKFPREDTSTVGPIIRGSTMRKTDTSFGQPSYGSALGTIHGIRGPSYIRTARDRPLSPDRRYVGIQHPTYLVASLHHGSDYLLARVTASPSMVVIRVTTEE